MSEHEDSPLQRYLKRKSADESGLSPGPAPAARANVPAETPRDAASAPGPASGGFKPPALTASDRSPPAGAADRAAATASEGAVPPPWRPTTFSSSAGVIVPGPDVSSSALKSVYEPGGFWWRFIASFVDGIIVSFLNFVLIGLLILVGAAAVPASPLKLESESSSSLVGLFSYVVVTFCYYGYFYSRRGATPGKMVVELEVIRPETGAWPSFWRSFFRESIGKYISLIVFGFGFLMALFTKRRRALHDLLFDTQVIHRRPAS